MYMGHSSSRGILIGDTARPAPNAVYGYYKEYEEDGSAAGVCSSDGCAGSVFAAGAADEAVLGIPAGLGNIVLETGEFKALIARQNAHEESDLREERGRGGSVARVFGTMGLMLVFCVLVWILFGFGNFLAALIFCVLAYFPLMVLIYARRNHYRSDVLFQRFRRHHGCEHAMIKLLSKNFRETADTSDGLDSPPAWLTLQNLSASPIYDAECGTVYAGYFLTLALELGILLSDLVNLGFWRSAAVLTVTLVLLVILIFIPWNPYKRLQHPAVDQPGEKEYMLGLAVLKKYLTDVRHNS